MNKSIHNKHVNIILYIWREIHQQGFRRVFFLSNIQRSGIHTRRVFVLFHLLYNYTRKSTNKYKIVCVSWQHWKQYKIGNLSLVFKVAALLRIGIGKMETCRFRGWDMGDRVLYVFLSYSSFWPTSGRSVCISVLSDLCIHHIAIGTPISRLWPDGRVRRIAAPNSFVVVLALWSPWEL